MKPWVTKKIVDYLGEEENTLIDFIMGKIAAHTVPSEILQQLTLVLDEEAEIFVVKMWRMLVYEMYTSGSKYAALSPIFLFSCNNSIISTRWVIVGFGQIISLFTLPLYNHVGR